MLYISKRQKWDLTTLQWDFLYETISYWCRGRLCSTILKQITGVCHRILLRLMQLGWNDNFQVILIPFSNFFTVKQLDRDTWPNQWHGSLSLQSPAQLHCSSHFQWRIICCYGHGFSRKGSCYLSKSGGPSSSPNCPVQLQVAEWWVLMDCETHLLLTHVRHIHGIEIAFWEFECFGVLFI